MEHTRLEKLDTEDRSKLPRHSLLLTSFFCSRQNLKRASSLLSCLSPPLSFPFRFSLDLKRINRSISCSICRFSENFGAVESLVFWSTMNIFRFAGDMTHLMSILILLLKIYATKSCAGISLKTQELYALVFLTRYLDLFTDYVSLYNSVMKIVFIVSSLAIVWCMRRHPVVRRSYDKDLDTFRHQYVVLACFVLALLLHESFTFQEVFWAFSIYLEAVAILPQLVLLQRSGNVDNLTGQYVLFLGAYRGLYIINWIYRYFTEDHFTRWIACVSGLVQTALYADFFYYYYLSWKTNTKLKLPA